MSLVRLLLCWAFVSSCVVPALPQTSSNFVCDQFTINPPAGPDNPLIIREGHSQTVTCNHDTIPLIGTTWYRDASAIREGVSEGADGCSCRFAPLDETPGTRELTFTDFAPASAGEYSCRVPAPPMIGVFNICRFDVLVAVQPSVSNLMQSYNRSVDSDLVIPIQVSGTPFPTITWRNDSTVLTNSSRVSISGSTGALTVTGLMPSDRGIYDLTLSNIERNVTRSVNVFVQFVEITEITLPVITNNEISVTCSGTGYPSVVVEWQDSSRNVIDVGTLVETSSQGTFEITSRNTLTVSQSECEDPYRCVVRGETGVVMNTVSICADPMPPPQPMNVMVVQNGMDSVRVSWTIDNVDMVDSYEVRYNTGSTTEVTSEMVSPPSLSTTVSGLSRNVEYSFSVVSVRGSETTESEIISGVRIEECSRKITNEVLGVTIGTAVNVNGDRTFNISWKEPQEDIVTGYNVTSDQGWLMIVNPKIVTTILTPANFCNGDDYKFVVSATNNCGEFGPPSAGVVGNCETLSQIKISDVKAYGTAITVKWSLKPNMQVQSPLSITVLQLQQDNNGQQLQLNYSITDTADEAECLGGLETSTIYRVCLHPVYKNGVVEAEPVCTDVTTAAEDAGPNEPDFVALDSCTKATSMTLVGSTLNHIPIPDYAIALIVVGILIIVAVFFCLCGICFACNNSRNKDIDDIGSDYESSIGGGIQGRMSSNHNRNMSPTRSCLSYHSKGHSTNWNDHMGTLREMDTEVGTNV